MADVIYDPILQELRMSDGASDGSSKIYITSVDEGNKAGIPANLTPVSIITGAGNFYPVEKASFTLGTGTGNSVLDVSAYLAYDDAPSFTGTWTVYCLKR